MLTAHVCAQMSYTTQHGTVPIIFPLMSTWSS